MNGKSAIARALLKYGYSNFSLEILEYCSPSKCLEREQYYLEILKPEYNLLKTAGSGLGRKHTEETKDKMSDANKGENNPMFGKSKIKGSGSPSKPISVLDKKKLILLNQNTDVLLFRIPFYHRFQSILDFIEIGPDVCSHGIFWLLLLRLFNNEGASVDTNKPVE